MFYEDYLIKFVKRKYRWAFKIQMSKWAHSSKLYGSYWKLGVLNAAYKQVKQMEE